MNTFSLFSDLLFPKNCVICGKNLNFQRDISICIFCENQIPLIREPRCRICGKPLISEQGVCLRCRERDFAFENSRSLFVYSGQIKKIIHSYKFSNIKDLSLWFAQQFSIILKTEYPSVPVIPVPGNKDNISKRGWDHIKIITSILSKNYSIEVIHALGRKRSESQKSLSLHERRKNLQNIIYFKRGIHELPKEIILLDDVFTTGSTLDTCSRVLKEHGAEEVKTLTLAID